MLNDFKQAYLQIGNVFLKIGKRQNMGIIILTSN